MGYTAALLAGAGADGLHADEENWILGHQACFGAGAEVVSKDNVTKLKKMTVDEVAACMKADKDLLACRRMLIYHCVCAAAADGVFDPEESVAIKRLAAALQMNSDDVDEIIK